MFAKIITKYRRFLLLHVTPRFFTTTRLSYFDEIPIIHSIFNSQSQLYQAHKRKNEALLLEFNTLIQKIIQDSKSQTKYLVRERINTLLDSGSPFLELSQLAGHNLYESEETPSGGLVTGIGLVHGRFCMIIANDFSVKKGKYYPITIKKHIRAQEIARENRLPCIYLLEPGSIDFIRQDETFPDQDDFGGILYQQGKMSSEGIPQVSIKLFKEINIILDFCCSWHLCWKYFFYSWYDNFRELKNKK